MSLGSRWLSLASSLLVSPTFCTPPLRVTPTVWRWLLVALIAVGVVGASGPAPARAADTITSFRPTTGAPGTAVRIYGTGFDTASAAGNTVRFGGTTAPVDSVTGGVLYVRVPTGVRGSVDLSVTSNAATATAARSFTVASGGGDALRPQNAGLTDVDIGTSIIEDFNNDGAPDLLVTGNDASDASTATTYLGDGRGGFQAVDPGFTGTPTSVADLNGDGVLDVIVGGTEVYLGDGSGQFTATTDGITDYAASSAVGDVDGDGNLDVYVSGVNGLNSAADLYLGDGQGSFTQVDDGIANLNGNPKLADLDNDGTLDLLLLGGSFVPRLVGSATAYVFLGDGTGQFSGGSLSLGSFTDNPVSLADVNADGALDLLLHRFDNGGELTLYLGDGQGGFANANAGLTGIDLSSWSRVTDVDGNGAPDLVLIGADSTGAPVGRVHYGDGTGAFTEASIPVPPLVRGVQFGVGDVDGDGQVDVLLQGSDGDQVPTTRLLRNETIGVTQVRPTSGPAGTPLRIYGTGFAGTAGATQVSIQGTGEPVAAPVDSVQKGVVYTRVPSGIRGRADVSVTNTAATTPQGTADTTAFNAVTGVTQGSDTFVDRQAGLTGFANGPAAIADVNDDGRLDVIVGGRVDQSRKTTTLYLAGEDGFSAANAGLPGSDNGSVSVADVNGDGHLDVFVSGLTTFDNPTGNADLFFGDGTGQFTRASRTFPNLFRGDSEFGDVDGDGALDLVLVGTTGGGDTVSRVYFGDGQGGFTETSFATDEHDRLALLDANADPHLDVVVSGRVNGTRSTTLYLGDGQGGFTPSSANLADVSNQSLTAGDANGDGRDDLLISGQGADQRITALYLSDGAGGFTRANAGFTAVRDGDGAIADFTGNGAADVLVTGQVSGTPVAELYEGDGQGSFTQVDAGFGGAIFSEIATDDFDGDGDLDVVVAGRDSTGTDRTRVYRNGRLLSVTGASGEGVNFGRTIADRPVARTVAIGNESTVEQQVDLRVDTMSFALGASRADTTIAIPPNDTARVSVTFAPTETSSGINTARDTLRLSGQTGVLAAVNTSVPLVGQVVPAPRAEAPRVAPVNESVTVTVGTPGNLSPTSGTLYYRPTGTRSFQDTVFTPADAGAETQVDLPAEVVTKRGVDVYAALVESREADDLRVTVPFAAPEGGLLRIRTQTDSARAAGPFPDGKYRMISVPFDAGDRTIADAFQPSYGAYDAEAWRLLRYDASAGRYLEQEARTQTLRPGRAYWLITDGGSRLTVPDVRSTSPAPPDTLALTPGWNQVGTPYAFPVAWDDVVAVGVDAESPRPVSAPVGFDPTADEEGAYRFDRGVLEPWNGYFVFNRADSTTRLVVPPREAPDSLRSAAGTASKQAGERYRLRVKASMDVGDRVLRDRQTVLGFAPTATAGFGSEDTPKPPLLGDHVRVGAVPEREGDAAPLMARSWKPTGDGGQTWTLRVGAEVDEPYFTEKTVRLHLSASGPRPDGYRRYVLDLDRQRPLPMDGGTATVRLTDDHRTRRLRVIVGTKRYATQAAGDLGLQALSTGMEAPYPNPATRSTTITYALDEAADVTIEVYDVLGRRIQTLVDRPRERGRYEVTWNGRSHLGRRVASGAYFLRFTAGDVTETRKVMVVR